MKFDMSGGAAVIESLGAIAQLGLPATVTGIVPATEACRAAARCAPATSSPR